MEFVEEGGDEPTRPLHTVGTVREFLEEVVAMVLSEVLDLDALRRPGARLKVVTRRRADPSRMADTSGRAPGSGSEGGHHARRPVARGGWRDVAWRQRPLCCGSRGLRPDGD